MNLLTFDIEEWVLEKEHYGNRKSKYIEYNRTLDYILKLLADNNQTATFFCLGKIAKFFPDVIQRIVANGHEIGSHSNAHIWVNKMTPIEFQKDTDRAIKALEDVCGKKIVSFRAPAFSIGEENKWAIEILAEFGIQNDASIFPGVRDFGGFPAFNKMDPCKIEYNGITLNEFPIHLFRLPIIGFDLAYSGGGYFRLLPIKFVKRLLNQHIYNMCYFHIEDLLTEKVKLMSRAEYEDYFKESGTLKNRIIRYIKSNIGRGNALNNLEHLITNFHFQSLESYDVNSISEIIHL